MRRPGSAGRGLLLSKGDILSASAAADPSPTPPAVPPPAPAAGEGSHAAVARNAFALVLGQVATTALAIVLSAALGRSLGAADFGVYYLLTTMATFAYVFVEWGQPLFVIRQVAMTPQRGGELLGSGLALRVAFAAMVAVPTALVAWALRYGARVALLALLLVVAMVPMFLAQAYGMVFRARDQMGKDALVSVANKAIALGLTLPALALGYGLAGIILALAVSGVAALLLAIRLYRGTGASPLRVSRACLREVVAGGVPIVAMTAAVSAQPYLDAIILSKLVPAPAVGWFGAARNILGTVMAPAGILGAAAYPRLARASRDPVLLRVEVRAAMRPLLWMAALGGTGIYLFAAAAIRLIYGGSGFGPAAVILQVFAPGIFLLFIDILLGNIVYASGGASGFAVGKIVSVVVAVGLDLLLIPWFQAHYGNGGIGVMVAFSLSEVAVFTSALLAMKKGTLDPAVGFDAARAMAAAAATIGLFQVLPALPPWLGIPLCVAAFTAASVALGLVSRSDLAVLRVLVRR